MNFKKGFSNIFSPSITNLLIALSLVIIVILVYIKNKNVDLFGDDDNLKYLQSIVNKYIAKQAQKSEFGIRLATQEQTIQNLQAQADNLFSTF